MLPTALTPAPRPASGPFIPATHAQRLQQKGPLFGAPNRRTALGDCEAQARDPSYINKSLSVQRAGRSTMADLHQLGQQRLIGELH